MFQVKSPVNGKLKRYNLSYVGERGAGQVQEAIQSARAGYFLLIGNHLNNPEVLDRVEQLLYRDADSRMGYGHHDPYRFDACDVLSVVQVALRSIEEEQAS